MRELTEQDIIAMICEEWDRKIRTLVEIAPVFKTASGVKKSILTKGLKLRHKKSGFEYTIRNVTDDDIELETPEGKLVTVTMKSVKADYELG